MSFFRSEPMTCCQLILHQESAFDCLVELGYLGKVHFISDSNASPNLKFTGEVQRSAAMQRLILRFQEQINNSGLISFYYPDVDQMEKPEMKDLQEIEATLLTLDGEFTDVQRNCDSLEARKYSMIEEREVLLRTQDFLTGARNTEAQIANSDSMMKEMLQDVSTEEGQQKHDKVRPLNFITGSIPIERFAAFEVCVWRVSRGNAYVRSAPFEVPDPYYKTPGRYRHKRAFIVVFMGKELQTKLTKVCQSFQTRIFPCPVMQKERLQTLKKLEQEIADIDEVFEKTYDHKKRILGAVTPELYIWRSKIRKILAVYTLLNQLSAMRQNFRYLIADCWIPTRHLPYVRTALQIGAHRASQGEDVGYFPPILNELRHSPTTQPTYFSINKFTKGFQALIDSYGLASYQEVNPAPYTIITFPFLFAVMFGDFAHGMIMAIFSMILIKMEKKIAKYQQETTKTNEIFNLLYGGRYITLLMGVFSMYTGFIYNDILSKSINIFGSSWHVNFTNSEMSNPHFYTLDPVKKVNYRGQPYVAGLDPVWALSQNAIIMTNSIKMKIAIVLGVAQMIFGLTLSAWNALFFRNKSDFYLVFLPQITFFSCLFFYLVVMVFHKWIWFGGHRTDEYKAGCAPSILIAFINMVLLKAPDPVPDDCTQYLYKGEQFIERALLLIAIITIPILLCGKPIHLIVEHRRIKRTEDQAKATELRRSTSSKLRKSLIYAIEPKNPAHKPEEKLSEIWIHQGIHTIESVLGSISHTASYLRLWALSLAHAQLAEVLWKMVLRRSMVMGFGYVNSVIIFFAFGFFAILTLTILVVMEGLSAFLHTLRLHWVEFQSKFYSGVGEPFMPFYFEPSKKSDMLMTP